MSHSDVLIIGGGPAGSTAATLLALEGFDTTLLEAATFPRYHIGESLVPSSHRILDLLDARDKVSKLGFRRKPGQYFAWGGQRWDYQFDALSGQVQTWQVDRSTFDHVLLNNAAEHGVRVHQGRRVTDVQFANGRPTAVSWVDVDNGTSGTQEFSHLIDASGRAGVLTHRQQARRTVHDSFRNIAVWAYWDTWRNLPHISPGATIASSITDGWIWAIPLADRISVGMVVHISRFRELRATGRSVTSIYQDALHEAADIPEILNSATRVSDIRTQQDYSYSTDRFAGPGFFLCGDAACFLDPLLSTGIHLAMTSGLLAAAGLCEVLRGSLPEDTVTDFYQESYQRTYLRLLVVVSALYKQYAGPDSYFWQAKRLSLRDCDPRDVKLAFLDVVTGVSDLRDLSGSRISEGILDHVANTYQNIRTLLPEQAGTAQLSDTERETIGAADRYWRSMRRAYGTGPNDPIAGLHLTTQPRLGLVRHTPERPV